MGGHAGYRLDVQGLRGISVLLVVLYHAGLAVPGGFIGVDVFFVISGYVIGASLFREATRTGSVDLMAFYGRRVRRLLPASLLMLGVGLVASIALLEVGEIQERAASTARAAAFSLGNLELWGQGGSYFGPTDEANPFLHTWSLGVEEQFYLVAPILIWGTIRLGPRTRWSSRSLTAMLVGALAVASFLLAVAAVRGGDLREAFYSPISRFWEIAVGVVLAAVSAGRVRGAATWVALSAAIVAWSVVAYDSATPFPGLAALPVVAATAVALVAIPSSVAVERALSVPALVWIGDRSYGWYLWHWPFIVFARQTLGVETTGSLVAAAVALVPSMWSYRFVERPIIHSSRPVVGRRLAIGMTGSLVAVAAIAGLVSVGAASDWGIDRPTESPDGTAHVANCHANRSAALSDCTWGDDGPLIVVLGDSHAASLADGVIAAGDRLGMQTVVSTANLCPFVEVTTLNCGGARKTAWALVDELRPDLVVLAHHTETYLRRAGANRGLLTDESGAVHDTVEDAAAAWELGLVDARQRARRAGAELVVIGTVPQFAPRSMGVTLLRPAGRPASIDVAAFDGQRALSRSTEIAVLGQDRWIDLSDVVCEWDRCAQASSQGTWWYFDNGHLNRAGSLRLSDALVDAFVAVLPGER